MKFKLDENMPASAQTLLRQAGHDVHSVFDESLGGAVDDIVANTCRREQRVLITLDTDFSDVRVFPPHEMFGIILLRPHRQSEPRILNMLGSVLRLLDRETVHGFLWIVEPSGIRIR